MLKATKIGRVIGWRKPCKLKNKNMCFQQLNLGIQINAGLKLLR